MSAVTQDVKDRYNFSAYILRNDYYNLIQQCIVEEKAAPEEP